MSEYHVEVEYEHPPFGTRTTIERIEDAPSPERAIERTIADAEHDHELSPSEVFSATASVAHRERTWRW